MVAFSQFKGLHMTTNKISFHFLLKDEEGYLIDSSYDANLPIQFTTGKNELFPKILESNILPMNVGDKQSFHFTPEEAFGLRDESRVIVIPINEIRLSHSGQNITVGQKVHLQNPDSEHGDVIFTITGVMNGMVALDGNHPFAGVPLIYEIEVIDKTEIF